MKKLILYMLLSLASVGFSLDGHPATNTHPDWQLAVQSWSFSKFTFLEALEKTASLGVDWMEAYPGQKMGGGYGDEVFNHHSSVELKADVKALLKERGIRLCAYGVVGLPGDEVECRRVFEFAKEFGIGVINSEPSEKHLDMIEALCREFRIKLGIHNHPKPSHYWDPDVVLAACKGRSHWIGACADTGHWVRSGLDPLVCLKKLNGRINSLHLKEIDKEDQEPKLHDVVWGQGKSRVPGLLEELNEQGFKGVFSVEYEHNKEHSLPEIAGCVSFFNDKAANLSPSGWKPFLADDLSNVDIKPNTWTYEKGVLEWQGGGDLWTKQQYGNFILDLEFKTFDKTNSGVILRAGQHSWLPWPEVQIGESAGKEITKHICGAIFDVQPPAKNMVKPIGQWNRLSILADGPFLQVVINGVTVVDINLNHWTEARKNPDGSKNKFKVAYKDLPRSGVIGLQDHHHPVTYRNLKIKELSPLE